MKFRLCCIHPKVKDEATTEPALRRPSPVRPAARDTPRHAASDERIDSGRELHPPRVMFRLLPEAAVGMHRSTSDASLRSGIAPGSTPRVTVSAPATQLGPRVRPPEPAAHGPSWEAMPELDGLQGEALVAKLESPEFQRSRLRGCAALDLQRRGLDDEMLARVAVVLATEAPAMRALSLRGNRFSDKATGFVCGLRLEHLDLLNCGLLGTCLPMFERRVQRLIVFSHMLPRAAMLRPER